MRCIHPAMIVRIGATDISIGEIWRRRGVLEKGLVLNVPRPALGRLQFWDRSNFYFGRKSTVFSGRDIDACTMSSTSNENIVVKA
jgi:hypothetical protein